MHRYIYLAIYQKKVVGYAWLKGDIDRWLIRNRRPGLKIKKQLFSIWKGKELKMKAQSLVEYALILVLVAVTVIAILAILGPSISEIFNNIVNSI
jgi:pilus assembly protein Flp/PilA